MPDVLHMKLLHMRDTPMSVCFAKTGSQLESHTHTHARMYVRIHTHTCARARAHTHTHTHSPTLQSDNSDLHLTPGTPHVKTQHYLAKDHSPIAAHLSETISLL